MNFIDKTLLIKRLFLSILWVTGGILLFAQDPLERTYLYPVLKPEHAEKAKVSGWATMEIKEKLNRGFIASELSDTTIYFSWRLLETDSQAIGFNLYAVNNKNVKTRLNSNPITKTTDFVWKISSLEKPSSFILTSIVDNKELEDNGLLNFSDVLKNGIKYKSIKLKGDYIPSKIAIADLNGDGSFDYIIKQPNYGIDPALDADKTGTTYKIEAYLNDGTFLWQNDLGPGIEPGIWYSPFIVFDLNGDGKAEIAVKTSEETMRNSDNRITSGPEYISIWDGMTGKEIARDLWPDRSPQFGDYVRINRNQMGIAFLDGKTPCLLVARGTYKLMVLEAYQFNINKLEKLWRWDGDDEYPVIRHQGAHGMHSADIDNDGSDEVILGSVAIDDNGTALWSTGYGHPDKCYVSDIDPNRPGLEIFYVLEDWHDDGNGVCLVDAKNGSTIWGIVHKTLHVGDGMVADINPAISGLECFASEDPKGGSRDKYLLSAEGKYLAKNDSVPDCRNWIFWDDDLLRETFTGSQHRSTFPLSIVKYNGAVLQSGIEGKIMMMADFLGDWREELITALPGEIRIYSTTIPSKDKRICLMQDRPYRIEVAHRSMGYEQSPVTGFYLGEKTNANPTK